MHITQERSALAAYDVDRRARAQPRDRSAQTAVPAARALDARRPAMPPGPRAGQALELNHQQSSLQSAQVYLSQLASHLGAFKREVGRGLSDPAPGATTHDTIVRSVARLNDLLDSRSRLSAASLNAQLEVNFEAPQRSRFSIKGLESLESVQASGSETLLFNAGRHLPGPMAVVLDEGLNSTQILRRFNVGLAPAGVHVEQDEGGALRFSAVEAQWDKLKGQLSVQGEDKLFAKGVFTALVSQEDNLLGTPLPVPQADRADWRPLLDMANQGLQRINGLVEQLNQRQAHALDHVRRKESQDEKRWAHDFVGRAFAVTEQAPAGYKWALQVVLAQAHVTRHSVLGLLA